MLQVYACMIKENDVRPGRKLQKVYIKKLQAGFYLEAKTFQ